MNNLEKLLLLFIICGTLVVGFIQVNKLDKSLLDNRDTIYVQSIFGCVPLKDKYTPAQWAAKQDLNEKVFGYRLVRCN